MIVLHGFTLLLIPRFRNVDFPRSFLKKFLNGFPPKWSKMYEEFLSEPRMYECLKKPNSQIADGIVCISFFFFPTEFCFPAATAKTLRREMGPEATKQSPKPPTTFP